MEEAAPNMKPRQAFPIKWPDANAVRTLTSAMQIPWLQYSLLVTPPSLSSLHTSYTYVGRQGARIPVSPYQPTYLPRHLLGTE